MRRRFLPTGPIDPDRWPFLFIALGHPSIPSLI